jgi:hypothetical protein
MHQLAGSTIILVGLQATAVHPGAIVVEHGGVDSTGFVGPDVLRACQKINTPI